MSRSLGRKARKKESKRNHEGFDPESEGWRAHNAGQPKEANRYWMNCAYSKAHAWDRGWKRAWMAAQRKK